jgi:hypothetical protein
LASKAFSLTFKSSGEMPSLAFAPALPVRGRCVVCGGGGTGVGHIQ